VGYAGKISNAALFGPTGGVDQQLSIEGGRPLDSEAPDWLRFEYRGKTLLVAARPLIQAVSWNAIARAGAALVGQSFCPSPLIGWKRVS
jgi:hypothetical protein